MRFLTALALTLRFSVASAAAQDAPLAELQYLQHSGWVVQTSKHVLVFDYVESLPSGATLPAVLRFNVDSLDTRRVVVFISHSHADHFDPGVATWGLKRRSIQYVVGSSDISLPGAKVMRPRETWISAGLTVKTTGSTDEGVGFLVSVDGLTFYHAGDHARWVDALDHDFMAEIQWPGSQAPRIDVAFFPIATGATCDPRPAIWEGVRAAALELLPKVLVPMHVGCSDRLNIYARFRTEVGAQLTATQVVAPARIGESFRFYGTGKLEARH